MAHAQAQPAIVLYDDHCGICTGSARRGMRYQRKGALRWLGNSTDEAQGMLERRGLLGREQDTLIVFDGATVHVESAAVVRAAQGLRWPWRVAAAVKVLPRSWRDAWYRRVARNRKHQACRLPQPVDVNAHDAK